MTETLIKFCGFTRHEDVAAAVSLGVNAIGIIAAPSVRRIEAHLACELFSLAKDVERVVVARNLTDTEIVRYIDATGPTILQHYGAPSTELRTYLQRNDIQLMTAWTNNDDAVHSYDATGEWILLDSSQPGSGHFDSTRDIPPIAPSAKVILAGGLTSQNVLSALTRWHPAGVDVSSGIESGPGIKDSQKMKDFVQAVWEYEAMT